MDNCKERFRNIRTSFARSINVQRGTNRIKPYYLSEELEFLKKHITPGVPVPVKGRRSRDSSNRRGDENDEYDENDEEEPPEALLHIKHSLSSDEYAPEEEGSSGPSSSAEWVSDEHAPGKHDSEPEQQQSQSDEEEQKPQMNLLLHANATRACSFPPKKRRRMAAAEVPGTSEVSNQMGGGLGQHVQHQLSPLSLSLLLPQPAAAADADSAAAAAAADTKPNAAASGPDFDDAFLQGLRPEMKHMNFHQKLFFKRRVYELLGEIFDGSSCQTYTNGQTPATAAVSSTASNTVAANAATPSPTSLHHLGLLARSGALQLPKLAPKPSKDL